MASNGHAEVELVKEREHKHSWRYRDAGESETIDTLYVSKVALAQWDWPEKLKVTIEPAP